MKYGEWICQNIIKVSETERVRIHFSSNSDLSEKENVLEPCLADWKCQNSEYATTASPSGKLKTFDDDTYQVKYKDGTYE